MAKSQSLAIVNRVLLNIGEPVVSSFSSLTVIQQLCFDSVNEAIHDLATEYDWQPLEALGTFSLATSSTTYAVSTACMREDIESFRAPDANPSTPIDFLRPEEWDREYPEGIGTATTGYPTQMVKFAGYYYMNKYPGSIQHTKVVHYRYWSIPTLFGTGSTTGTCWLPEGFDLTLLTDLATYKVMHYKNNSEAQMYYRKVYGGPTTRGWERGSLDKMKDLYGSPILKLEVDYEF